MYSTNNPINAVDLDGRDIIVLLDKEGANGAGHSAVLIGNDKTGWKLYSKNSGQFKVFGKSEYQDGIDYATLSDFYKDTHDEYQKRYESGFRIETNEKEDEIMKNAASKQVKENYLLCGNSCIDTSRDALNSIGLYSGSSPIPNIRFYDIIKRNRKGSILSCFRNPLNFQVEYIYNDRNTEVINIDKERKNQSE